MSAGVEPVARCGERLASLLSLRLPSSRRIVHDRPMATPTRRRPRKRHFSDPGRTWAKGLERRRPGLVAFVLDELAGVYGRPAWQRRLDPTSELILTILTQNSADIGAEVAFEALRTRYPGDGRAAAAQPGRRLGRRRAARRCRARLGGDRVRATPRADRDDLAGRTRQPESAAHPGHAAGDPRGTRRLLARVPRRDVRARGARLADPDRRDRQEDGLGAAAVLVRAAAHAGRSPRRSGRSAGRADRPEGLRRRRPRPVPRACSSPTRCTRPTSTSSSTGARSATPSGRTTMPARCGRAVGSWTRRRPDARAPVKSRCRGAPDRAWILATEPVIG